MSARLKHLPLPASFVSDEGRSMLCFGRPESAQAHFELWSGSPEKAADLVRALNAYPRLVKALQAARDDCRDSDTDAALSPSAGALIEEALAAAEARP